MLEKGYDATKLFDGGVATMSYDFQQNDDNLEVDLKAEKADPKTVNYFQVPHTKNQSSNNNSWLVTKHIKPQAKYYDVLCKLAANLKPDLDRIIFIDDKKPNVDGANLQKNVTGIQFESAKQLSEKIKKLIPDFEI